MYKFPLKGFKQSDTPTFIIPRWIIPATIGAICFTVYALIRYYQNKNRKAEQQAAAYQETLNQKEAVLAAQKQELHKYGLDRIQSNTSDKPA